MENVALFPIKPSEFIKQVADAVTAQIKAENYQCKEKDLLTQKEACELLSISKSTLINWQNEGIITYQKKKGRTYYSRKELLSINTLNRGQSEK